MKTAAIASAVLSLLASSAVVAQEVCTSEQDILGIHRMVLVERLGPVESAILMSEIAKMVGDPPQPIAPSAILVFRLDDGSLSAQLFDENRCASFGASFNAEFYGFLRSKMGVRA